MRAPTEPNLFVVGAPKAGTTSLHDHLSQHPDVFMSPLKETMYFASEFRYERFAPRFRKQNLRNAEAMRAYFATHGLLPQKFAGIVESRGDYLRLFDGARDEKIVGEATPAYLWSPTAAASIAAFAPGAKIIMVLRNPIDRAFSAYLQTWNSGGFAGSFGEYILACRRERGTSEISTFHPGIEAGLYAESLQRYRDHFPDEQLGVWLYEQTSEPDFHARVFRFLGVDESFRPDTSRRHLQQRVPRVRALEPWAQQMKHFVPHAMRGMVKAAVYRGRETMKVSPGERAMLVQYYERDVERLSEMLGKDLRGWLR